MDVGMSKTCSSGAIPCMSIVMGSSRWDANALRAQRKAPLFANGKDIGASGNAVVGGKCRTVKIMFPLEDNFFPQAAGNSSISLVLPPLTPYLHSPPLPLLSHFTP